MKNSLLFLSKGTINLYKDDKLTKLPSIIYEDYKRKLREIQQKNEWKTTGTGATFMGVDSYQDEYELSNQIPIQGIATWQNNNVVYSLNFEKSNGLYIKDIDASSDKERFILITSDISFFELDVDLSGNIIATAANDFTERHLVLMHTASSDYEVLTEGDTFEQNPKWSKKDQDIVYYDSCGIAYSEKGHFLAYGPKSIYRLNVKTKELEEILSDTNYNYTNPFEDEYGNLYYIKSPYIQKTSKFTTTTKDIVLAPFKVLEAIGGWLNFFTMRYSGKSLKSSGQNPSKAQQKNPEDIFINNNLIKVSNTIKQNARLGEQNPGFIPANWQLIKKDINDKETIIKNGVLDYLVLSDASILYSNGKYVLKLTDDKEAIITHATLATNLKVF